MKKVNGIIHMETIVRKDGSIYGVYDYISLLQLRWDIINDKINEPLFYRNEHGGMDEIDIFGCWSIKEKGVCIYCNTWLIECPKEGHPNSKYWSRQRTKDESLRVCPNNCTEDGSYIYKEEIVLKRRKKRGKGYE